MTDKSITVGDVRAAIKDLPDDMPVFLDDEHECLALLSIEKKIVEVFDYDKSLEESEDIEALVLGVA